MNAWDFLAIYAAMQAAAEVYRIRTSTDARTVRAAKRAAKKGQQP